MRIYWQHMGKILLEMSLPIPVLLMKRKDKKKGRREKKRKEHEEKKRRIREEVGRREEEKGKRRGKEKYIIR